MGGYISSKSVVFFTMSYADTYMITSSASLSHTHLIKRLKEGF